MQPSVASVCTVIGPIHWSITDSIPTQQQVIHHNAVWKSLCGDETPH